jgi:hypothetical protein
MTSTSRAASGAPGRGDFPDGKALLRQLVGQESAIGHAVLDEKDANGDRLADGGEKCGLLHWAIMADSATRLSDVKVGKPALDRTNPKAKGNPPCHGAALRYDRIGSCVASDVCVPPATNNDEERGEIHRRNKDPLANPKGKLKQAPDEGRRVRCRDGYVCRNETLCEASSSHAAESASGC